MTIRQRMIDMMADSGMFDADAEAVMAAVEADPGNSSMRGRWDDRLDTYPPAITIQSWMTVKRAALAYIDANIPQAWFRPMFVDAVQSPGATS